MVARARELDLADIWLFSNCSVSDRRVLRRSLEELTISPGTILCEEGTVGREFFIIVAGSASVRRSGRKVASLGPGGYFGELALLDKKPRSATVVAETEMTVLVLGQAQFHGVLDAVPSLSRKLLAAMAARLRASDARAFN